jgi:ATP-dependent DNA helicase RecG
MLKDMPRSKVTEIAEAANLSEIATKAILDASIECGIVDIYGSGRNRTYILSPKVYSTKSKRIGYVRQVDIDETRYPELIINLAKTNDFISRADVVQLLHVDNNKAYRLLKGLAEQGVLEPVNKGRYAKYRYCDNA